MRVALVLLLGACGRVGFDPFAVRAGDGGADGAGDGRAVDVAGDAFPVDLIAYFPLDGTLEDVISGTSGTCAAGQCPTAQVAGHLSAAMLFDGLDDCVSFPDSVLLDPPQLTIAVWAKPAALAPMTQISKRVDDGGGNPLNTWQLEMLTTPSIESFTTNSGGTANDYTSSPTNAVVAGTYQHMVGTFDGTTATLYVDGQVMASQPIGALAYGPHGLQIGCDDNNGLGAFFQGELDELRIYNRALTPAEVQALP